MVPCPQLLPLSHLIWSMCSPKAGELEDCKKALFLLYIGANSISMGANITQYLAPDSRWVSETLINLPYSRVTCSQSREVMPKPTR